MVLYGSSPRPHNPDPQDLLQQLQASGIVHLRSNFQQPEIAGAKLNLHETMTCSSA